MLIRNLKKAVQALEPTDLVVLEATDDEDVWSLYNLISAGDQVQSKTTRKVAAPSAGANDDSGKQKKDTKRVTTELAITVANLDFDARANELRLTGLIAKENAATGVSLKQHHTLTIRANTTVKLTKLTGWDTIAQSNLSECIAADRPGAVPAVILGPAKANILLIHPSRTAIVSRIDGSSQLVKNHTNATTEKAFATQAAKALDSFHEKILRSLTQNVDFTNPRDLLLVSPGYYAKLFRDYVVREAIRTGDKKLHALANGSTLVACSTTLDSGISRILASSAVRDKLKDLKFGGDAEYVDRFNKMMTKSPDRTWYGEGPVAKAIQEGAVGPGGGLLLINDTLFRSQDLAERKKYVALVDKVKNTGGEVKVLSAEHPAGDQLKLYGNIAAILTYPMQDLDDDSDAEPDGGGEEI